MNMEKIVLSSCPEWIEAEDGAGTERTERTEKKVPRFRMVANTGGPMQLGGFPKPVIVELAGVVFKQSIPIRLNHQANQGIGHTERIKVENGQLVAEGIISRENIWSSEVVKSGKLGFPWQASIGGSVLDAEDVPAGQVVIANGQSVKGPCIVVRKMELKEISFVDNGADEHTKAEVTAERKVSCMDETKENENELKEQIAALQNEMKLLALRASRPSVPVQASSEPEAGRVLEASFLMNCGMAGKELEAAGFNQNTINAASEHSNRGESIQSVIRRYSDDNSGRFTDGTIRAAFQRSSVQASGGVAVGGYSTVSLPGIFSNVANKLLEKGYLDFPDPTSELSKDISVNDFKETSMYTPPYGRRDRALCPRRGTGTYRP